MILKKKFKSCGIVLIFISVFSCNENELNFKSIIGKKFVADSIFPEKIKDDINNSSMKGIEILAFEDSLSFSITKDSLFYYKACDKTRSEKIKFKNDSIISDNFACKIIEKNGKFGLITQTNDTIMLKQVK